MRPSKLIVTLAAAVCAFAVCNARAQLTNSVTFSLTMTTNAPSVTKGSKTTETAKSSSLNNASLLQEIGKALKAESTNAISLSSAAKLVLVTGEGADFAVIDTTNLYPLTNIMTLISTNYVVETGSVSTNASGLPSSTKQTMLVYVNYDDTGILTIADGLQFSLTGLVNVTQTDSAASASTGNFTQDTSAKFAGVGAGQSDGNPFLATGTLTVSGKGELSSQ